MRVVGAVIGIAALLVAGAARADLAVETATVARLPPLDGHRLYVLDTSLAHPVDSKVDVIDGDSFRLLGQIPNGSFGEFAISNDGKTLYSAASWFARGDHGARTEVLELYDPATLDPTGEVILSPKRAQSSAYSDLMVESSDGALLFVQNATPASSVQIVDLKQKKVIAELPTAGCYGLYPSSKVANRFSTLCGDGTAVTVEFDATGKETARRRSARLFDPEGDALFIDGVAGRSSCRSWAISTRSTSRARPLRKQRLGR